MPFLECWCRHDRVPGKDIDLPIYIPIYIYVAPRSWHNLYVLWRSSLHAMYTVNPVFLTNPGRFVRHSNAEQCRCSGLLRARGHDYLALFISGKTCFHARLLIVLSRLLFVVHCLLFHLLIVASLRTLLKPSLLSLSAMSSRLHPHSPLPAPAMRASTPSVQSKSHVLAGVQDAYWSDDEAVRPLSYVGNVRR